MIALITIGWTISILFSVYLIFITWGNAMIVAMFPEGQNFWDLPFRAGSLALFAALVHFHPFALSA